MSKTTFLGGRRTKIAAAVFAVMAIAGCASLGLGGGFQQPIVNFKDLRVRGLGLSGGSSLRSWLECSLSQGSAITGAIGNGLATGDIKAMVGALVDDLNNRGGVLGHRRRRCEVTVESRGVTMAWPYRTPSSRTEAPLTDLPGMPDLRFRVFESVRIHFRHVGRRTANAVWE